MVDSASNYPSLKTFSEQTASRIETAIELYGEIQSQSGQATDASKILPGTPFTPAEIQIRAQYCSTCIKSIVHGRKSNFVIFSKNTLNRLETACSNALRTSANLLNQAHKAVESTEKISVIDNDQYKITYNDGAEFSMQHLLKEIDENLDSIINNVGPVEFILRSDGFNPTQVHLSQTKESAESARKYKEESKNSARAAKGRLTYAEKKSEEIDRYLSDIETKRETAEREQESITTKLAQIDELLREISETEAKASQLNASVDAYGNKFANFTASIDAREERLTNQEDRLNDAIKKLKDNNDVSSSIVQRASEALELGTAKGLASSFKSSESDQSSGIILSSVAFMASLIFFTFLIFVAVSPSLIPIVPDELMPNITERVSRLSSNGVTASDIFVGLSDITVRLLVIFPGYIAVRLTSNTLQAGLIARRQYQFKKTIAAALPSFKRQIASEKDDGDFGRAAALKACEALSENPDSRMRHLNRKEKTEESGTPFVKFYETIMGRMSGD